MSEDQDAVLQVLYANFGCFALLTAHKLGIFRLLEVPTANTTSPGSRIHCHSRVPL
jgi:hypothetical protein